MPRIGAMVSPSYTVELMPELDCVAAKVPSTPGVLIPTGVVTAPPQDWPVVGLNPAVDVQPAGSVVPTLHGWPVVELNPEVEVHPSGSPVIGTIGTETSVAITPRVLGPK